MRITRPIPRQRSKSLRWIACGCGALLAACGLGSALVIAGLLIAPPDFLFRLTGLSPEGNTAALFEGITPAPTIVIQNPVEPSQITVNLGERGVQTLNTDTSAMEVAVGSSMAGTPITVLTFTEAGLMELCRQRSTVCAQGNDQFKNIRLDLRTGGLIVYADANLTEWGIDLQQTVGIVMTVAANKTQMQFAGIDVRGVLFSNPPGGLEDRIATLERDVNSFLNQLTVDAGGGQRRLSEIQISDSQLTLILE